MFALANLFTLQRELRAVRFILSFTHFIYVI